MRRIVGIAVVVVVLAWAEVAQLLDRYSDPTAL